MSKGVPNEPQSSQDLGTSSDVGDPRLQEVSKPIAAAARAHQNAAEPIPNVPTSLSQMRPGHVGQAW